MNGRAWTLKELDRSHPEVQRKGWAWDLAEGSPFARFGVAGEVGSISVRVDEYGDGVRELCCERAVVGRDYPDDAVREDPDVDVALAVILASKGLDATLVRVDARAAAVIDYGVRGAEFVEWYALGWHADGQPGIGGTSLPNLAPPEGASQDQARAWRAGHKDARSLTSTWIEYSSDEINDLATTTWLAWQSAPGAP